MFNANILTLFIVQEKYSTLHAKVDG